MKIKALYVDDELEIDNNFIHIEFALSNGSVFKIGVNDKESLLYIYCDKRLAVFPNAGNMIHLKEQSI